MEKFETNILAIYGEKGAQWISTLPHRVDEISKIHSLSDLSPLDNLSYNYVLSGEMLGIPIILKISPNPNDLIAEVNGLKIFEKYGSAKFLFHGDDYIIMERAIPGFTLASLFPYKNHEDVDIFCDVIGTLHKVNLKEHNSSFPHLSNWLAEFNKPWNRISDNYLEKARKLGDYLIKSTAEEVLNHGDLHHDNILKDGHTWIVIDPQPVVAEKTWDACAFLYNHIPKLSQMSDDELDPFLDQRIERFSKHLNIPKERMIQWAYVRALLSLIWSIEGNDPMEDYFRRLLEIIYDML